MKAITLKTIAESLPLKKGKIDSLWSRFIIRPLSFLITYLFLKLNISATTVSVISIFISLMGSLFLSFNSDLFRLLGVIFIEFWLILDCVDGNIARFTKTASEKGEFFDSVSGYFTFSFVFLSLGIAAFHTLDIFPEKYKYLLIVLGAIASSSNILFRLIHQKFINMSFLFTKDLQKSFNYSNDLKSIVGDCLTWIINQLEGLFLPWLIFAYIFDLYYQIVIFYCFYYVSALSVYSIMYCYKAYKL